MSPNAPSTSTNNEVEAKILEVTPESIKDFLESLRAKPFFNGILRAQWMCNINGEKLRVRQEWELIKVEHKLIAPASEIGIKSAKETGFSANNFQDVVDTLLVVGFTREGLPSVKRRVSYLIGENKESGVVLDFDTYIELMGKKWQEDNPAIPTFLEIESKKWQEEVIQIAKILGFHESNLKDWWPVKLFQHYYPNETIL